FRLLCIAVYRQLKQLGAFPEPGYVALVIPFFQVCGGIYGVAVALVKDHHPMAVRLVPEYFRIARVVAVPLFFRINDWVSVVFGKCTPTIQTISDTLYLPIIAMRGKSSDHGGCIATVIARGIVVIDDRRARKHGAQV